MEIQDDEKVEVKPTWKLAWGVFWRMLLFSIPILVIGLLLYNLVWYDLQQKLLLLLIPLL